MKKFKILLILMYAFIAIFSLTSCKRSNLDDPPMQVNSGFHIILSGTAIPSTLYVPENNSAFSTIVRVQALDNKGVPVNGAQVIFEQTGAFFGYFNNLELSTSLVTNSLGIAQVEYKFPAGMYIAGTQFLYVTATLVDDSRLDATAASITDTIPIKVIENANTYVDQFELHGDVNLSDGSTGITGVQLTFTNLGNGTVTIINRASGSWEIMVPKGWTGSITPTRAGYTFSPSYRIIATPVSDNIDHINFTGTPN